MSSEQVGVLYAYETRVEKDLDEQEWADKKNCSCESMQLDLVRSAETTQMVLDSTQNDCYDVHELDKTQGESIYGDLETAYETGSIYECPPSEVDVEMIEGDFEEDDCTWNVSRYSPAPSEVDVEIL